MNLARKLLDSIIALQPKTESAYVLYSKLLCLPNPDGTAAALSKLSEVCEAAFMPPINCITGVRTAA